MSTRKRRIPIDTDEDELSPSKPTNYRDVFSSAKKRKLNSSPIPPGKATGKNFVTLSGLVGFGKGPEKENTLVEDDEDIDELDTNSHNRLNHGVKKAKRDVWDVPDDEEVPIPRISSARRVKALAKAPDKITTSLKVSRKPVLKLSDEEDIEEPLPKRERVRKIRGTSGFTTKITQKIEKITPKRGRPSKAIAIETSEENEEDEPLPVPESKQKKSTPKPVQKATPKAPESTSRRGRRKIDIDAEIEDSEEERKALRLSATFSSKIKPGSRSSTIVRKDHNAAEDTPRRGRSRTDEQPTDISTSKPKLGRPRKDVNDTPQTEENGDGYLVHEEQTTASPRRSKGFRKGDILKKAKLLSNAAARLEMTRRAQAEAENEKNNQAEQASGPASSRHKAVVDEDVEEIGPRTSHQKTKLGPKVGVIVDSPMPKGILTPSGRKRGPKPRKSVIFQDIEEKDLGFKDLPDYSSKNKIADISELQLPSDDDVEDEEPDVVADVENEAGAESDESDELACSICNSLTSKRGNQILLCDRCDFAVHQQCYMLPKVPEGEWLCQVCEAKREDLALEPVTALEEISSKLPDIRGFEHHLQTMQTFLLGRLTGECRMPLHGHDEEMEKLHQVVKQTVLAGEGNSMLVIGARGVGKTTLVDAVISDLSDHRDNFHVVRLNGFIHTDDKLALKDIWRQLGREMEIEDDSKATANDTLQSLLALLSHPSELAEIDEGHTTKSVVFILDEFDLFTTHPRQTLLYNLFDIAQARKAPIVVLGLTTRVDVAEALEKRVKSRFSHRYIHLSLPRSIPAFRDICKGSLTTSIEDLQAAGFDVELDGMSEFVAYWQTMIDDLCKEHVFKYHLETLFYKTKSTPEFLTSCILPVANLSTKNFPLKAKAFVASNTSLSAPDSKLHILQGLSELELALLISAARLDIILDTDTCNFAMVYDEYCSLTSRHKIHTSSSGMTALGAGVKVWGRDVALGAWERLADYDILVPAGVGGTSARDSGTVGRMWKADVALEEIAGSVSGLSFAMAKWCREI